MIEIMQKGIERPDPLFDADGQAAPFGGGEDTWDDVEGNEALGGFFRAIDGEGDAEPAENAFGLLERALHIGLAERSHPVMDLHIGAANRAVRIQHFVEEIPHASPWALATKEEALQINVVELYPLGWSRSEWQRRDMLHCDSGVKSQSMQTDS